MTFAKFVIPLLSVSLLAACSGGGSGKKVTIMSSGKITVNEQDQKNITLEPGTTHNEKEVVLSESDKATLTVTTPEGKKTFDVDGNGHYLLNLKTDTLTGGAVKYGGDNNTKTITLEDVNNMIDSTEQLLVGKNTTDANKTYFLPPFTIKKVSDESSSRIVGPYNGIPGSVSSVDGKTPEIYKFFTNKDQRQSLEKLRAEQKK
jgi:hypothetical protein